MSGYIEACHKDKDCCCKIINNVNVNTNCGRNGTKGDGLLREFNGSIITDVEIGEFGTSFVTVGTVSLTIENGDRVLLTATIPWFPAFGGPNLILEIERNGTPIYTISDSSITAVRNITTSLNFLDTNAPAGLVQYTLKIRVNENAANIQGGSSVIFTASRIIPNP